MKFKSKLKVALDMCINDKWKFRAALITTVAFLCNADYLYDVNVRHLQIQSQYGTFKRYGRAFICGV